MLNRMHNSNNPYQGTSKRVLSVCSAGLLRSPTVAWVLSNEPFNYNTRSCGISDSALIPIDDVLIHWAEKIIFVEYPILEITAKRFDLSKKEFIVLNIPDIYPYRDSKLVELIAKQMEDFKL